MIGRPLYQIYVYDDSGFYQSEDEVPVYYKLDGSETYLGGISTDRHYSGLLGTQKLKDLNQQFADIWIRFGKKEAIPL